MAMASGLGNLDRNFMAANTITATIHKNYVQELYTRTMAKDGLILFVRNLIDPTLDPEAHQSCVDLIEQVAQSLRWPRANCRLVIGYPAAGEAIEYFVRNGYQQVVVLVLALGDHDYELDDLASLMEWQGTRQKQTKIVWGGAIGLHDRFVEKLAANAEAAYQSAPSTILPQETAIALIGRGSGDPKHNAELPKIARLVWEGRSFGWVEAGFYNTTQPNITNTLLRCIQLGAKQIVVLPYLLHDKITAHGIGAQVRRFQNAYPQRTLILAATLADNALIASVIATRCRELLQDTARHNPTNHTHSHGMAMHANSTVGIDKILPPRYQGNTSVSAAPMSAAPLVFDDQGQVDWQRVWGGDDPDSPFCELAIAGGPPHRGELLEPVLPTDVMADYAAYGRVLAELTRGIQLTTQLTTQLSPTLGWIGVRCESEDMAIWLLRAILVENVAVRREGEILYLPAGPQFRLEYEIKNVITALAKTHHYWLEHRVA